MKLYFTLFSTAFQTYMSDMDYYDLAVKSECLIKIDEYDNELIVSKIPDGLLLKIIEAQIQNIAPSTYEDELIPLDGGLRIVDKDLIIEHQCCSELNDYRNWEKIIADQSQSWKEVWIGHPSIYYRIANDNIELSEYYDTNPSTDNIKAKLVADKVDFFQKLTSELKNLEHFKSKLYQFIENNNFENKELLKTTLLH